MFEPLGSPQHAQRWEQLLGQMSRDETLVDQTVAQLRASVPGYDNVPTDSLQASVRRNIALTTRTIRLGLEPRPEHVAEADSLALERHAQGVPIGSVLAGFRVSLSMIYHRVLEQAPHTGLPAAEVLASSTLLWALGDAFSTRAVAVYQDKEVSRAVADSARRAEWIRNVVTAAMAPAERIRGAALYDVPASEPLRVVVADSAPGTDVERQQRLHAWAERAGSRLLATVQGHSLVGIMIGRPAPDIHPKNLTVGLGQPSQLDELPRSFESASLALQAGENLGKTGVVDLERLSWRLGVHSSPETTEMLYQLHLAPLEGSGEFGQHIIEAVNAYLNHRLSIPLAARSIPVHVNTLRYRLQRFSELTGADLGDLNTLIELSWILASHTHRQRLGQPAS